MDMEIRLSGNDRVDAFFRGRTVTTEQDGASPAPIHLFLASIGTCAGYYVAKFCQQRAIPTDDIRIRQRSIVNKNTRLVERLEIDIQVPEGFPERYRDALVRAADLCTVKKHLEQPPELVTRTVVSEPAS